MNGKQLQELRLKLNLSQQAMGDKIGITRQAVAKIESGENNMRRSVAMLAEQLVNEA